LAGLTNLRKLAIKLLNGDWLTLKFNFSVTSRYLVT